MPTWNLRGKADELYPLAPFILLAVMCHPDNRAKRERMLGRIRADTHGVSRWSPLTHEEFLAEVESIAPRASLSGSLLMTLLQLDRFAPPPTLNIAIATTQPWLPRWEQSVGPEWSTASHVGHMPHSRRRMLGAFDKYLSVAHLWAALLHAQQHQRPDLWPDRSENVPAFLGAAEVFLELGCRLPWLGTGRRRTLPRNKLWRFAIPARLRVRPTLEALPLSRVQQLAFDELKSQKPLSER